jgi:hypothetical protein
MSDEPLAANGADQNPDSLIETRVACYLPSGDPNNRALTQTRPLWEGSSDKDLGRSRSSSYTPLGVVQRVRYCLGRFAATVVTVPFAAVQLGALAEYV